PSAGLSSSTTGWKGYSLNQAQPMQRGWISNAAGAAEGAGPGCVGSAAGRPDRVQGTARADCRPGGSAGLARGPRFLIRVFAFRPRKAVEDRAMPGRGVFVLPLLVLAHPRDQRFEIPRLVFGRGAILRVPRA